jgi:hypothetical protein
MRIESIKPITTSEIPPSTLRSGTPRSHVSSRSSQSLPEFASPDVFDRALVQGERLLSRIPKAASKVGESVKRVGKYFDGLPAKSWTLAKAVAKSPLTKSAGRVFGPIWTIANGAKEIYQSDNRARAACEVGGELVGTGLASLIGVSTALIPPVAIALYGATSFVLGTAGRALGGKAYEVFVAKDQKPATASPDMSCEIRPMSTYLAEKYGCSSVE